MRNSSKQAIQLFLARAFIGLDEFKNRHDVVFDREPPEDRGFLRQISDTQPGTAVHWQPCYVPAVDGDAASIGRNQPGDHIEYGRLTGAVRSEKSDRLSAPDRQADALDDLPLPIGLFDIDDGQPAVSADRRIDAFCFRVMPRISLAHPKSWRRLRHSRDCGLAALAALSAK